MGLTMEKYKEPDFLNFDVLLSEEERTIRDTVRSFTEDKIIPVIAKHYREGTSIPGLSKDLGSLGVFGATLPEQYGCAGLGAVAYGLMMQELERGDSAVRSFASVQSSLVMYPIFEFGSEEQRKKWLPGLASGEKIGCFGLTEPNHGSDPGGMETTATKTPNGYKLNGAKMWITNGSIADVAVVWAKLDGVVRGFLVEKGTKGFSAPEIKGKLSLRASVTSELSFSDCEISAENILPGSGGLKSPLKCLNQARYGISFGAIGAAQACYHEALQYSLDRKQFDRPLAGFQLVQKKLVEMITEITKAQGMALQLGRLKERNLENFSQVSMAKRNNVRIALKIARTAREILGANGISDEFQSMRHSNNLESVYTYEGTDDVHALIIGEKITGISAFR
jgi:glutaryl-CoA dehydrogenase